MVAWRNIYSVSVRELWISMVRISVIAVFLMLVTACSAGSPVSVVCGGDAPVVTRGDLGRTGETEPEILARRVTARAGSETDLEIPDFPGYSLTGDIERVLGMIRAGWPETAGVNARPRWQTGTLILHLEPSLFEAVTVGLPEEGASALFCAGHPEFDALSAAVGLRGVKILSSGSARLIVIGFDPREDVRSASVSYGEIEGVISAEPDFLVGDGSDIEMLWSGGRWYAVFRRAWGDCPTGCIFSELHFFVEREGEIERVDPERAAEIEEFARVLSERGWTRRPEGRQLFAD